MRNLNILVVDDEPEITEIIGLLVGSRYNADFSYAHTGKSAIASIAENRTNFDLIICDFNMPNGNGKMVFDYLNQNKISWPFILLTSDCWEEHPEFNNKPNTYYVQKPFDEDNLISVVTKSLESQITKESAFIGISLATLLKIQKVTAPLYIKINESKYVKVINEGSIFNEDEYNKYKQKQISSLFVSKVQFDDLILDFKNQVLGNLFFSTYKSESRDEFQITASVNEIINSSIISFGFSDEAVSLAKENIKFVKAIVTQSSDLQNLLRWINSNDYKYELTHSMLICFLATAIAQKFKFQNPHACENIALAAFFHDISLDAYQIENEPKFKEALRQGLHINKVDVDIIRQHPKKSIEMLGNWSLCPKDVLSIIENHCERPDGRGFPKGAKASELDEMSACFLFCEDLINFFLASRSKARVEEFLTKNAELYSTPPFNAFTQIVRDLL
jgi:response regulator RpfG family c-di-GMP phosphodiesterase